MEKKFKLTKQLPEPFNTALQLSDFIFDYHLMLNQSDHEWLIERGYELKMGEDCAIYVKGVPGLCATSYGDWGTAYYDENGWEGRDGFDLFCEMYNEGIVTPWRIWIYHDSGMYYYDNDKGVWSVNHRDENYSWVDCENPLPKILSETTQNDK